MRTTITTVANNSPRRPGEEWGILRSNTIIIIIILGSNNKWQQQQRRRRRRIIIKCRRNIKCNTE